MDKLENPIWYALTTSQIHLSQGDDLARRFHPDFTSLGGLGEPSKDGFESLAKLLPEQSTKIGLISKEKLSFPDYLICLHQAPVTQMICHQLIDCGSKDFVELTSFDVDDMKMLVALTQPGPFANRTIEFGSFIGIRDGGQLVAMAGERMRIENMQEVSAVCTHPEFQGRGYARALVSEIARRIFQRGQIPFLHVRQDNIAGITSYKRVGFEESRTLNFQLVAKSLQHRNE